MSSEEPRWRRYLRFFGPRGVADLDDELRFHVESRVRDYMARGMSESDARAAGFSDRRAYARARAEESRDALRIAGIAWAGVRELGFADRHDLAAEATAALRRNPEAWGGRPVLICPPTPPQQVASNVLIHWNCSTEQARAVALAMPLLRRAASYLEGDVWPPIKFVLERYPQPS